MELTHKLILASASPRRSNLLKEMGLTFTVRPTNVDEILPAGINIEDAPAYLSELKAKSAMAWLDPSTIILTADSVVLLDGALLGKPVDLADARKMLKRLSAKTQTVVTGMSILSLSPEGAPRLSTTSVKTHVFFESLTDAEIEHYTQLQPPLDKAGAYGIQDWIGWTCISRIEGSYANVMGLPTSTLWSMLKRDGYVVDL